MGGGSCWRVGCELGGGSAGGGAGSSGWTAGGPSAGTPVCRPRGRGFTRTTPSARRAPRLLTIQLALPAGRPVTVAAYGRRLVTRITFRTDFAPRAAGSTSTVTHAGALGGVIRNPTRAVAARAVTRNRGNGRGDADGVLLGVAEGDVDSDEATEDDRSVADTGRASSPPRSRATPPTTVPTSPSTMSTTSATTPRSILACQPAAAEAVVAEPGSAGASADSGPASAAPSITGAAAPAPTWVDVTLDVDRGAGAGAAAPVSPMSSVLEISGTARCLSSTSSLMSARSAAI